MSLADALSCWRAGDFQSCLSILDELDAIQITSASVLLRARALLRVGAVLEARSWLYEHRSLHVNRESKALHLALFGSSTARSTNIDSAFPYFQQARALRPSRSVVSDIAYYHALALMTKHEIKAARAVLGDALAGSDDPQLARALLLSGFLHFSQQRYAMAKRDHLRGIAILRQGEQHDAEVYAKLVHGVCLVEAETETPDAEALDELRKSATWSNDLEMERIQITRLVAYAFRRQGDDSSAFQLFLEILQLAPFGCWAVMANAEAALISLEHGEARSADAFVEQTWKLAQAVPWTEISGEGRFVPLLLVTLFCRFGDEYRARLARSWYDAEAAQFPNLRSHGERFSSIWERQADGLILCLSPETVKAGLDLLGEVQHEYERIRFRWRAADVRVDIGRILGKSRSVSRFLSQRAGRDASTADPATDADPVLTATQTKLLELALEGLSRREIASAIGLSENTVRNYLGVLYDLFQVSSRSMLIAKVNRTRERKPPGYAAMEITTLSGPGG